MATMNKPVIAGIAAGILLAGIILGPIPEFFSAQAQEEEGTTGNIKRVTMIADEVDVQIAPDNPLHPGGVMYRAMVFNGTIPGPVVSVDQGDTIEFTLINEGDVIHSMDFHAGDGTTQAVGSNASATGSNIQPGESVTWTWTPKRAGAFYYHCGADGLNGVWEHIANGMYGGVVVHPENERPAKEFYVVFGEIYTNNVQGLFTPANGTGPGTLDLNKFLANNPDIIMTNGMAHKYVPEVGAFSKIPLNPNAEIFQVQPGELTRWFVFAPGPNQGVAFHFISGIISVHDGSVMNRYGTQVLNDETWWIPPGSGSVIEAVFPDEGIYVGVDHAMNNVLKGAAFAVLATPDSTPDDHPAGTMVPPRGSDMVSGPPMAANATAGNATAGPATNATEAATEVGAQNQTLAVVNATGANETRGAVTTNVTDTETAGTNATEAGAADSNATEAAGGAATNATEAAGGAAGTGATGGGTTTGVSIAPGSSSLTTDAYEPNPAQVSTGATLTWTNDDSQPHTATSGENATPDQRFDSGIMAPAAIFEHTFTEAGEYPYFCLLHPNMVGTVNVS
jgi:nitrite reductase (NO-forming)